MSVLEQGMADQRVVRITYAARDGATTNRDVEPLIFASRGGCWYLICWCRLRHEIRWFLVSGIGRANATTIPCENHTIDEIGIPPDTARSVHG